MRRMSTKIELKRTARDRAKIAQYERLTHAWWGRWQCLLRSTEPDTVYGDFELAAMADQLSAMERDMPTGYKGVDTA